MCLGKWVSVFGFCVKFSGGLFECDGFNGSLLFKCESFAFVIEFAVLGEWDFRFGIAVEADLLVVFVGLGADAPWLFFLGRAHLHLQIADHLNDHYYISKCENYCKYLN